jgi:hypothetical protein
MSSASISSILLRKNFVYDDTTLHLPISPLLRSLHRLPLSFRDAIVLYSRVQQAGHPAVVERFLSKLPDIDFTENNDPNDFELSPSGLLNELDNIVDSPVLLSIVLGLIRSFLVQ